MADSHEMDVLGIRGKLAYPFVYDLFTWLIGYDQCATRLVNEHVRPFADAKILDMGCGLGKILGFLPPCHYVGFDMNRNYVRAASARYAGRGEIFTAKINNDDLSHLTGFDIAMAIGVVHHLDDDGTRELFRTAKSALKPGGRLVTFDSCIVENQSRITRYLFSMDRGAFIRTEDEYQTLARKEWKNVRCTVHSDLLRIPYTHVVMECS